MKTWLLAIVTACSVWGTSGCSSSTAAGLLPANCYGPGCASGDAGNSKQDASSSTIGKTDPDAGTPWSPLCGPESIGCIPEFDAGFCDDVYDSTGDAGTSNLSTTDAGIESADIWSLTCRIRSVGDAIMRACESTGSGGSGAPCRTTTDCGKGLTCVAEDSASICRPYCCSDAESCPSNTYCNTRSTVVARSGDNWTLGPAVPVCTPAENCPLSEPSPCPQNQNCTCPATKACMIVRRQGLTACVKPGTGVQGEFCPCAAGFVCTNTTFTCLKLCHLSANSQNPQVSSMCDTGTTCQASNDVPPDWGVCTSVPPLIVN